MALLPASEIKKETHNNTGQRTVHTACSERGKFPSQVPNCLAPSEKARTRVRCQRPRPFIPIWDGKLARGGRPRGTPNADTRTLFSRQRGGGQRGFMTACSTCSAFQPAEKKRGRERESEGENGGRTREAGGSERQPPPLLDPPSLPL